MKKIILLVGIIILISGTPYQELNQLLLIDTIAITKQNNDYHLYLSAISSTKEEDSTKSNYHTYEIAKPSLLEAIHAAQTINNKKAYYQHLKLIIIDQDLLQEKNTIKAIQNSFTKANFFFIASATTSSLIKNYPTYHQLKPYLTKQTTFYKFYANYLDPVKQAYLPLLNNEDKKIQNKQIYLLKDQKILQEENLKILHLLENKETSYESKTKDNGYYILEDIHTTITYQNKNLSITISATLNEESKKSKQEIKKELSEKINTYFKEDQQQNYPISSIFTSIYRKTRNFDQAKKLYQQTKITTKYQLKKGKNNEA